MDGQQLTAELVAAIEAETIVLPGMPDIAHKVRAAVDEPKNTAADIAKLIQADVALTARLIQIANSPMYRGITPVASCRAVVNRLGMTVTRNLVMVFAMRRVFSSANAQVFQRLQRLWDHSAQVGAVSAVLARLATGMDSERALLAGLVHDVGLIPALEYLHKHALLDAADVETWLAEARGPVGRAVLKAWRFDETLLDVPIHAEDYARDTGKEPDYFDVVAAAHWKVMGTPPEVPNVARKFTLFMLGEAAGQELLSDAQLDIGEIRSLLN